MANSYVSQHGLHILDTAEPVVATGKTLMINLIVFIPVTADGDDLILHDAGGNVIVDMKGLKNKPNPIPFPKPLKADGLDVDTIDSGKALVYCAIS